MEERLISNIKILEKLLKEKRIKKKVINRLYETEYQSYNDKGLKISYKLNDTQKEDIYFLKELAGAIIPTVKKADEKIEYIKNTCALNEKCLQDEKNIDKIMIEYLLRVIATDTKPEIDTCDNILSIQSGFTTTTFEIREDKIIKYGNAYMEEINNGVNEFLKICIYADLYRKSYNTNIITTKEKEFNLLSSCYLIGEITRVLNFIVFETEDYSTMLDIYVNHNINSFLGNIASATDISLEELIKLYSSAYNFLENRTVVRSIYLKEDFIQNTLKDFINSMYILAKNKKIANTEHFFSKLYNKDIFNVLPY